MLVSAGMVLLLAACGAPAPPFPSPVLATPDVVATPPVLNEPAFPTRTLPTPAVELDAAQPLTLMLWVPEEFAPGAERGGDILEARAAAFEAAHSGVTVNYVLKAPYGKGGIVDWLMQLQELMPERLPDAAIVDSRELDQLEKLGLLQPLNHDLPSGAFWDLFAPAQLIARQGGVWSNQPLVLDVEHLLYDTKRVPTPPATWQAVLADRTEFAFAADSTDTFLLHYLENGGSLSPAEHPALDSGVMQAVLDYYQRTRANGNLNEAAAMMKSAREVFPLFLGGQAPLAQVRARDYLSERTRMPNAAAAPIPTRDGRATTLASGWSYVILTSNPARRRAAADYLEWLNDAEFLAQWTQAARLAPARKSAFAQAGMAPEYADALSKLLENAIVAPSFSAQAPYASAWHTAVQAVLNGQLSPEDAAFRALQTITQ
ncbi:MAG: extracellular solute-binding protein [Chloroflexi bacterium]|nr:extracellular solute-binding protein [Chloroflexota bacterium]